MAKKNNIINTIKGDLKALGFQAGYNALVDAVKKIVPDTGMSDDKLNGLIAGAIYYYFSKNGKKYGEDIAMAVRLEALGDVIQEFGENIPLFGGYIKTTVSPLIEGTDEDIEYIEALRDDEFITIEGYDPKTDTFSIEGKSSNGVEIIESL
jgi:hypothetical protein